MRPEFLYPAKGGLTHQTALDALSLVMEKTPTLERIKEWSRQELIVAYDWAMREHLYASDNDRVRRREQPWFLKERQLG